MKHCMVCGYEWEEGISGKHSCTEVMNEKIDELEDDKLLLLKVCKAAHRKHSYGDDSIGWEELSEMLADTLSCVMGEEEYGKWQVKYGPDMSFFG